jgi:protein SCO1/2
VLSNRRKRMPALFSILVLIGAILAYRGGPATAAGDASSIWGADYFPNTQLITQEGTKVRFFDDLIKDKVVVINFIFTRCPDACPLETARLREVQKILGDRVGQDVFMYSISIDPEYDTPEVLSRYREKFRPRLGVPDGEQRRDHLAAKETGPVQRGGTRRQPQSS